MTASLFDEGAGPGRASAPLAVRMRPRTLDELVGQAHLLEPGSPLRRLVATAVEGRPGPSSVILWGPPGTGKTTLANLVSTATGRRFVELSAVTAGVKDVREVVERARDALGMHDTGTVLFVDEVHRFSKTQQDALLPAVENGWVTLVAATTRAGDRSPWRSRSRAASSPSCSATACARSWKNPPAPQAATIRSQRAAAASRAASFSGPTGSGAAIISFGYGVRRPKRLPMMKPSKPSRCENERMRVSVGSSCASSAVLGFSPIQRMSRSPKSGFQRWTRL